MQATRRPKAALHEADAPQRAQGQAAEHARRLEALGALSSGVAHEINTPIQFIGDNLQFIGDSFQDLDAIVTLLLTVQEAAAAGNADPEAIATARKAIAAADLPFVMAELPQAIEQSIAGVRQVSRIVSAMKAFAHPGAREAELADINQAIELTTIVSRNEWKYVADLELSLAENLPRARCHIGELSQVWLNLIVNAAQAIQARPDLERGRIEVSTTAGDGSIEVRVADNGVGVPAEIADRIFNPFFSTKAAGEGSGQGLAIAREIVVGRHGGDIWRQSGRAEGACFVMRLPLVAAPAGQDEMEKAS